MSPGGVGDYADCVDNDADAGSEDVGFLNFGEESY